MRYELVKPDMHLSGQPSCCTCTASMPCPLPFTPYPCPGSTDLAPLPFYPVILTTIPPQDKARTLSVDPYASALSAGSYPSFPYPKSAPSLPSTLQSTLPPPSSLLPPLSSLLSLPFTDQLGHCTHGAGMSGSSTKASAPS